jgi:glycosyltransferase involved in cell wall biosynthesis
MPAYNAGDYVRQAIDSVLNQTYGNIELLIADDCSTDHTRTIIDSYPDKRIKRFHNGENQGYLKTTNLLFDHAKGELITFQDADDWSDVSRIEILYNEFAQDAALGCIGSFVNKVDIENKITDHIRFKCSYEEIASDLPEHFNCVGSALMIRKEVLPKIGGYHLYFDRVGSEDLYWYGKIVKHFKTINIPQNLYFYRSTPGSVSKEKNKSLKKLASKEIASKALAYYLETGRELFDSKGKLSALEAYLLGKYACWNTNYKTGTKLLLRSILSSPFTYPEKYTLLRIYLPLTLKGNQ